MGQYLLIHLGFILSARHQMTGNLCEPGQLDFLLWQMLALVCKTVVQCFVPLVNWITVSYEGIGVFDLWPLLRSYIYLDGTLIADDSGLHGMVERCGARNIGAGSHSIQITGFQGGGGVGQQVKYYGPDTGGVKRWLRSSKALYHVQGNPAKFSMCIFQAGYGLSSVPWLSSLGYVGVGQMSLINLNNAEEFRQVRTIFIP